MSLPYPTSASLHCHQCGYDLRAQPPDGICPECAASVKESQKQAALPTRPAWRNSDPRWRRRMIAAAWFLTFAPLSVYLENSEWASETKAPNPFGFPGGFELNETFARTVYPWLVFCIGVVLLFSKERNRRPSRVDFTRRWGVVAIYGVFFLGFIGVAFLTSLVLLGIVAIFQAMPPRFEPGCIPFIRSISIGYMLHGPHPGDLAALSADAFSSIAILLGCVPLYNALRSAAPRILALLLLAPLFTTSLIQIYDAFRNYFVPPTFNFLDFTWAETQHEFYFNTNVLFRIKKGLTYRYLLEVAKCSSFAIIALWLTIAQIASWFPPRKPTSSITAAAQ